MTFNIFNKNILPPILRTNYNPVFTKKKNLQKKKIRYKISFLRSNNFLNKYQPNSCFNNYFPIYNSRQRLTKKFRKVFKSSFSKRYTKGISYYVIPIFEKFLNKKFFIKSVNNNYYNRIVLKKKKIRFRRIYKIYIKNKRSVLSRTNRFNLLEMLEIIFYSIYHKDLYILKN